MKRPLVIALAILIILVVLLSAFFLRYQPSALSGPIGGFADDAHFYVGVTYCGNSTTEAKLLIDRVKSYTNLFVLQSGEIEYNRTAVNEVCSYAAASGLYIVIYFGALSGQNGVISNLLKTTFSNQSVQESVSWHSKLVGIYFGDEPGGKMLDLDFELYDPDADVTVRELSDGRLRVIGNPGIRTYNGSSSVNVEYGMYSATYYPDGRILMGVRGTQNYTYYVIEKDGTVYLADQFGRTTSKAEDHPAFPIIESYESLMAERPFQNYDDAARRFVNDCRSYNDEFHSRWILKSITSDYGLYWWDYLGSYDSVLAQFGWNNSVAQEISLARGAANLQGKDWGAIVTWTYTHKPYLASGDEIYGQMVAAYEAGAKYILIFNYAEDMEGPYGTMQDEHFDALERFWNNIVQNPSVTRGGVKAEAALVLPNNYGWGLRNPNDTIWGFWQPDTKSPQVWTALQESLAKYGSKLDIVFDDPEYPAAGKYPEVIYWNQTS